MKYHEFLYCNVSSFFLLLFFGQCHFLWDIFILFVKPFSSFMLISLPLLSFSGFVSVLSHMAIMSTFPKLTLTPFTFDSYFSCGKFLFLCFIFVSVHQFPLLIIHFCIMSYKYASLSLRNEEMMQLHALGFVHELNNRCAVTNHKQTLKELMWLVHNYDVHLLLR